MENATTKKMYDKIISRLQDLILEKYFSPEYFDEEEKFDVTESVLLESEATWEEAMEMWKEKHLSDSFIDAGAIANYIAKRVPANKAYEALRMAPDKDLFGEYLFDEEKIDWYRKKAYAQNEQGWVIVSTEENGLFIVRGIKSGTKSPAEKIYIQNPEITDMHVDGNDMVLTVKSEDEEKTIRIPIAVKYEKEGKR